MAERLGFANRNFISMVEGGKSALPALRIFDFAAHYEFSEKVACGILYSRFPEHIAFLNSRQKRAASETQRKECTAALADLFDAYGIDYAGHDLQSLLELWDQFDMVPRIPNETIMRPFLHFPSGTREYEVERWFRAQFEKLPKDELNQLVVMASRAETRLQYGEAIKKRFLFFPEKTNKHQIQEWISMAMEK